jgi:hypothetical protein
VGIYEIVLDSTPTGIAKQIASGRRVTLNCHGVTVRGAVTVAPLVAEMVTLLDETTVRVVTVKVALVFPAATVTFAGTVATVVALLERVTTVPAAGAGPLRVTVPVDGVPPFTVVGFNVKELTVGAVTVSDAVLETVPSLEVIVTMALDATAEVVIVKLAVVKPAVTVALAGTSAADVLLLDSVTTAPPGGAAPVKVIVPVDEVLPTTDVGFTVAVDNAAAVTVRVAVFALP